MASSRPRVRPSMVVNMGRKVEFCVDKPSRSGPPLNNDKSYPSQFRPLKLFYFRVGIEEHLLDNTSGWEKADPKACKLLVKSPLLLHQNATGCKLLAQSGPFVSGAVC